MEDQSSFPKKTGRHPCRLGFSETRQENFKNMLIPDFFPRFVLF
jgi:hypothetical protein